MMFHDSFLLMLSYVDDQWIDIAGNQYPGYGYIEAREFSYDIDIQKGLYGIPWGITSYFVYEQLEKPTWFVVKTEKNDNMIKVNNHNRFKFKDGFVVHHGKIRSCASYIWKHKNTPEMIHESSEIQLKDIAGSDEWRIAYNGNY